jgi:hypothetical protein
MTSPEKKREIFWGLRPQPQDDARNAPQHLAAKPRAQDAAWQHLASKPRAQDVAAQRLASKPEARGAAPQKASISSVGRNSEAR